MKKLLLFLILVGFLFSCSQKEEEMGGVKTGAGIDWGKAKIGDKVNIVKTTTDEETLFDYTGFHFGEPDSEGFTTTTFPFEVKYFNGATVNMDVVVNSDYWDLTQNGNLAKAIETTYSQYKQTFNHARHTNIDWNREITSTNIRFRASHKDLYLKGLNDGTGTVEVVGYTYMNYGEQVSEGDVDFDTPMMQ